MKTVLKIFALVGKILLILLVVASGVVSLATAYIVFMPDTLPKPFYLQYAYPTPVPSLSSPDAAAALLTPTPQPLADIKPGEGIMFNTGTKIINLAEPGGRRYIRITVILEYVPMDPKYPTMTAEEKTAYLTEFTKELTDRQPLVDDTIITSLSSKSFDQLYTSDGKEALRTELLNRVNQMMPEYKVISVYFSEFVVE